jgi:uncharacterized protein YlxW (UPF0749 family)
MDHDERIAVLETEVKEIKNKQDEMLALQRGIGEQLARYKGFLGGVAFVGSGLWIFLGFMKEFIFTKFGLK